MVDADSIAASSIVTQAAGSAPRVVLEAGVLARTLRMGAARNGIFRVVDALAKGLAACTDLDLALWVPGWWDSLSSDAPHTLADYVRSEMPSLTVGVPGRVPGDLLRWAIPRLDPATVPFPDALRALAHGSGSELRLADRMAFRAASLAHRGALWQDARQARRLLEWADIYHATFYSLPRDSLAGVTTFINVYDMIPMIHPQYFEREMVEGFTAAVKGFSKTDWYIAISEHTKNDLCAIAGVPRDRVIVALPAADRTVFYPCHDELLRRKVLERIGVPNGPYFLCLNTIEPRKNMRSVTRAFAGLVRQGELKDCSLVIIGSQGWQGEIALDGAEIETDMVGRVFFTGAVWDVELAPLYSGAVGFVYPSFYEGFGLPVLEAMQCGAPIITSSVSSLPEVVGDAGLMIDPQDLDQLCSAMTKVYNDLQLRSSLSQRSVARAATFSWERFVSDVTRGYRLALG